MVLTPPSNGSNYMAINESGDKMYELSNHLGNVLNVVADRKLPIQLGSTGTVDYYVSNVMSYSDYYPFGALLPGRHTNETSYRYGAANGQEKVDEISGSGNHYTAEYWEYDSRLARRWNQDPVVKHHESPYACFANNPIWFMDPNGADSTKVGDIWYWEIEHGEHYGTISEKTGVGISDLKKWNTQDPLDLKSGTLLNLQDNGNVHFVYESKTPEIYQLTVFGLSVNPSWSELTFLGSKSPEATKNRAEVCPKGACQTGSTGLECDEFPYASTQEGGFGSVSNCVPAPEQRIQGGQLGMLYRTMGVGDQFTVVPVPKDKQPERQPSPLLDPNYKPVPPRLRKIDFREFEPKGAPPMYLPLPIPAGSLSKAFQWLF